MKRFFYLCLALIMFADSARAFENEPEEGLTWMGFLGMNVSDLMNHEYDGKVGATVGFKADYMLPKAHGTYLTAGLDWSMKGGRISCTEPVASGDAIDLFDATKSYTFHYIEIPIRVGFRYNISEAFGIYGEIGPYIALGVGGRHKLSLDGDGSDVKNKEDEHSFSSFNSTIDLKKHTFQNGDIGVGLRIGLEYNEHYNLMLGFDWGLSDIYRDSFRDAYWNWKVQTTGEGERLPKVYNFNFNITAGYRF